MSKFDNRPGSPDGPPIAEYDVLPEKKPTRAAMVVGSVAIIILLAAVLIPLFWGLSWLVVNWPH